MLGYFQHELCKHLERIDFFRFSREFTQALYAAIPTIETLSFLDPIVQQPADSQEVGVEEKGMRTAMIEATKSGRPVLNDSHLFLPFPVQGSTVIAQAKGLDEYVLRKIGNDWLDDLLPLLLREFLLLKRACVDPLSGLLSSLHLEETLDNWEGNRKGILILLSAYPSGSSSFYAKKYQHRTVSLLKGYINERFPLFYLGQSCFGIVCDTDESGFSPEFVPMLVNYLKREHCSRVHVATVSLTDVTNAMQSSRDMVATTNESQTASLDPVSEVVMKKAWAALHIASKRGPFAFCNSSVIENLDDHPLAPPSSFLKRWLQKVSQKSSSFSLLQFAGGGKEMAKIITRLAGEGRSSGEEVKLVTEAEDHFLLLPLVNKNRIQQKADDILTAYTKEHPNEPKVNVGISIYSKAEKTKSDQLLNCRKALCHAAFLEPGSIVICDAVSFNVSGDIYYGDGDLIQAVREYKRGLQLTPKDGNLLNSLGVCYAQMNKHRLAVECFKQASASREDRFMAYYNLGLEQQMQEENLEGINSFSKALKCKEKEGQLQVRKDISFQLAVLCTCEKQYKKALALLLPWFEAESGGKALKYLGEIYNGLGQNKEAMKYLQQAMRYDEFDAEVLGLLGEIYLVENEGDDIALRFCEKAVELNPDSLQLKERLAKAQIQCGDLYAARKTLQPCLRNKKNRLSALELRAVLAREQGQLKVAAKWLEKADKYAAEIRHSN